MVQTAGFIRMRNYNYAHMRVNFKAFPLPEIPPSLKKKGSLPSLLTVCTRSPASINPDRLHTFTRLRQISSLLRMRLLLDAILHVINGTKQIGSGHAYGRTMCTLEKICRQLTEPCV